MTSTLLSRIGTSLRDSHRLAALLGFALVVALLIPDAPPWAQEQAPVRLWAAQTGPDELSLSWEPIAGAVEYRIHLGDPAAATTPEARRPILTLSGSSRHAVLGKLRGRRGRHYLVAVGSDGRTLATLPFNEVTPVRGVRPVAAPASVRATATGPEEVTLSWDAVPGATAYMIGRAVSPDGLRMLCDLCPTESTYVDRDVTPGATHRYTVAAVYPGGVSPRTASNAVTPGAVVASESGGALPGSPGPPGNPTGQPATPTGPATTSTPATQPSYTPPGQPAPSTTPAGTPAAQPSYTPPGQPAPSTPSAGAGTRAPQPCRLDYQRADNMWAAFGRPDGPLGLETITLQDGQTKVFVTDWKYEKVRNDGTNYYGSHMRIATNPGTRPIKLVIRSAVTNVRDLFVLSKSGDNKYTVRLDPGVTKQFSADLMEVSCTN